MARTKQSGRKPKNKNKNVVTAAIGQATEEKLTQTSEENTHVEAHPSNGQKKRKMQEHKSETKVHGQQQQQQQQESNHKRKHKYANKNKETIRLKKEEFEKEAPLSRYTKVPSKCGETIIGEVKKFLGTRITDKWIHLEKQNLEREHPESSEDSIDSLLFASLSKNEKFKGKDLKELISEIRVSMLIESTSVSSYISIGSENINTYIKRGGSISCMLCDQANMHEHVVCRESIKDVPIFVIPGLTQVLMGFTELSEGKSSVAFKKVKCSPFNDLLKLIAERIPDEINLPVSVQTADGLTQIPWKESIDHYDIEPEKNGHSSYGESTVKSKDVDLPISSEESKLNFTQGLAQISAEDQLCILTKIGTIFEYTFPRFLVTGKRNVLRSGNRNLLAGEIEKQLYLDILCNEVCSGLDIIDILSSHFAKSKNNYVIPSNIGQMYGHVQNGGSFHFILYCNSATDYINENERFQSFAADVPLFAVDGLSSILDKYYTIKNVSMLAFKKAEDNPLAELIKFVEDKIPVPM